jgi:uncharacterized protein
MIGRNEQMLIMNEMLETNKSSFLAVTGRRRVGKTYLIDQVFKGHLCLAVTGIQHGSTSDQISNFLGKVYQKSKKRKKKNPDNWLEVFFILSEYLDTLPKKKKHVIFLDELPWMSTAKSNFVQFLAHFWNDYLSKHKHFILVICGSATSWIQQKIVNDRGGLHNRLTQILHVEPFTLNETKAFLAQKKINLRNDDLLEIYMTMGGIPYYLENIKRGECPTVLIDRMCFGEGGILKYEYDNLFKALFDYPTHHEALITSLSMAQGGMNRDELIKKSKVSEGGSFTRTIQELISSGFVKEERAYGKRKQGSLYRVIDEYVIFYHRFIKNAIPNKKSVWASLYDSQKYRIWLGYAFENLCMKHIEEIKKLIGIGGIYSDYYSYRHIGNEYEKGFQIDLIIDRNDKSINLCECKFYSKAINISKNQGEELRVKKSLFQSQLKQSKTVFNTFISNRPVHPYPHAVGAIDLVIDINDIFGNFYT